MLWVPQKSKQDLQQCSSIPGGEWVGTQPPARSSQRQWDSASSPRGCPAGKTPKHNQAENPSPERVWGLIPAWRTLFVQEKELAKPSKAGEVSCKRDPALGAALALFPSLAVGMADPTSNRSSHQQWLQEHTGPGGNLSSVVNLHNPFIKSKQFLLLPSKIPPWQHSAPLPGVSSGEWRSLSCLMNTLNVSRYIFFSFQKRFH